MKEYKKMNEVGDPENDQFGLIPDYDLGKTPENLPYRLYRCITIKRGLVAAYEETILPDVLIDALVDLRHLADHCGVDFSDCDRVAYNHYLIEKKGD